MRTTTTDLTPLFAVAAGISVANMYYCQPIVEEMASTVNATPALIGSVTVATQGGTALGMFLFVPLGDRLERRRLIVMTCMASSLAAWMMVFAATINTLVVTSFLVGLTAIVPHLLIPFAAELARDQDRGRTVGTVVGGLLVGIVLSRTMSGIVTSVYGWRTVYGIAGALMSALAGALALLLPVSHAKVQLSYPKLLLSMASLAASRREVRTAAWSGALLFAAFSVFWTTLAFHLSAPPYGYSARGIGAFGLLAAASALVAPWVGRLTDRRSPDFGVMAGAIFVVAAFGVLAACEQQVLGLVVGAVLVDIGVQTAHVSNQARLYEVFTTARGRAVTIYMMMYFCGGALGSALGVRAYAYAGWSLVCLFGAMLGALACIPVVVSLRRPFSGCRDSEEPRFAAKPGL